MTVAIWGAGAVGSVTAFPVPARVADTLQGGRDAGAVAAAHAADTRTVPQVAVLAPPPGVQIGRASALARVVVAHPDTVTHLRTQGSKKVMRWAYWKTGHS